MTVDSVVLFNEKRGEAEPTEVVGIEFVVAGSDASKMFDFAKESLDYVPGPVTGPWNSAFDDVCVATG